MILGIIYMYVVFLESEIVMHTHIDRYTKSYCSSIYDEKGVTSRALPQYVLAFRIVVLRRNQCSIHVHQHTHNYHKFTTHPNMQGQELIRAKGPKKHTSAVYPSVAVINHNVILTYLSSRLRKVIERLAALRTSSPNILQCDVCDSYMFVVAIAS